jgi:hypothetical protein
MNKLPESYVMQSASEASHPSMTSLKSSFKQGIKKIKHPLSIPQSNPARMEDTLIHFFELVIAFDDLCDGKDDISDQGEKGEQAQPGFESTPVFLFLQIPIVVRVIIVPAHP